MTFQVEDTADESILTINSVNDEDAGQIICMACYACPNCLTESTSAKKCSCFETEASCSAELAIYPKPDKSSNDSECKQIISNKIRSRSSTTIENDVELPNMIVNSIENTAAFQQPGGEPEMTPALIICGPSDSNVFRGEKVVLRASYCGHPEPQVKWMKGVRRHDGPTPLLLSNH